jgi:malonyl-CoA/methylmalonyl-CoA synthetase
MNANIYSVIARSFPRSAAVPALIDREGATYTYEDLARETARLAHLLASLGLKPGDRVAAQVEKSPQALFLYLAAMRAGMVYLPLNTAYQEHEVGYFLRDAEPALVVCRPQAKAWIEPLAQRAGTRHVLTLNEQGGGTLMEAAAGQPGHFETAEVKEDDLACIIYTSGTTGRSKGAMLSHGNLASNGLTLRDYWRFSGSDVLIHALPLFHVHGLFVAVHCTLLAGACMRFHRRFDPKAVLEDFSRATVLMGVPTFYTRLLNEPELTREACRGMRLFVSGSAPLLAETHRAFAERTGHAILERYGMSEAGMITSNPYDGERRPGTVGFPLPGVNVRVADEQDRPLPAGQIGGVQVKGPNVFLGYWRMPDKTREEFTADGFFRTGDVGVFSHDGYLSIVGRAKDLVITGGYNVYPKEVELAIDEIPGVLESAVIGVPHPDFGEAVTAVVVRTREGAGLTEEAIIRHLKGRLAGYKVPKRVYFVEGLPRNAMGKVQKNVLRERFSRSDGAP